MQSCQAMLFSSLEIPHSKSTLITDEIASAVFTSVQAMSQLRKLSIRYLNPLPLLRALGDRDCPLEHVTVESPSRVCTILVCVY